jgi:hypothetical protein
MLRHPRIGDAGYSAGPVIALPEPDWRSPMSYTEARSHFEKARLNTADKGLIEMLDGLKHLTHAIEEDLRTLEQSVQNLRDIQSGKGIPGAFS